MTMMTPFVAIDLGAAVVLGRPAIERCIDVAWRASDAIEPGTEPAMRELYGALDRVLVAHVTSDPFVHEREGMTTLLRGLERLRVPALGVASFAPAVTNAIVRRLRWDRQSLYVQRTDALGGPLWRSIVYAAARADYEPSDIVFVSEDALELVIAKRGGCALPLYLGKRQTDFLPDIEACATLVDVLDRITRIPSRDYAISSSSRRCFASAPVKAPRT